MIFGAVFFTKFSGSQTFFEKCLAPFLEKYNICMRHYWLNRYLLWNLPLVKISAQLSKSPCIQRVSEMNRYINFNQ
jgi:hypothetical protein